MAGEKMVRDISGVYARLFDHRAVLQAECKYMLREFEGKRNDRELERLRESEQKIRQVQEEIPKCITESVKLKDLLEELKVAREKCHEILVKEEQDLFKERREEIFIESKKNWETFIGEIAEEEKRIEEEFEQSAEKLRARYGVQLVRNPKEPDDKGELQPQEIA
ncbi:predicted protein [Nematostella vectensis]|uniref:Biogenesis of lysosome-related organelles complex 1 subunit 5 n=1 Tax=Nematostella vectensis TaxID=45351 RepID=BL1S5_NEMVE|nr:RecName: Full=Biogenesis of lysosome-related organelles complex 1 subunit 5; Short=BLOC-1 subunit 5; AltName: Full=Protein Muted homolog [Nematostella vectensis]EDO34439.1 predicted protein [Nematostella vectensis]|eukprot:XP_001626539.1 predicted protein [Nematostella vectensis]